MNPSPIAAKIRLATPAVFAVTAMRPRVQRGFTLIEMLVVIAIGAILAAIGVPSLKTMLNDFGQRSTLSSVISDMNQARGEAIKRNTSMLVCARNTDGSDCANSANWRVGWLVCIEGAIADQCAASSATDPNPVIVRPALATELTLLKTVVGPFRFRANSTATADTLTLGGVWSGAVSRTITVAGTGNISK